MRALRNALLRVWAPSRRVAPWLMGVGVGIGVACRHGDADRALAPPPEAQEWLPALAELFDDGITVAPLRFDGRAPNDVLDQRLFHRRLGHSDLVALVRVEQVWGRGRHQGSPTQYIDVTFQEIMVGALPKDTARRHMLEIVSAVDVPSSLPGQPLLLFLRWAPSHKRPYHYHVVSAHDDAVASVEAAVDHARSQRATRRGRRHRRGATE
ncbi:MAG: hypothetical protein B7733_13550 [Myxococcales bacterium FL481]|nr:MAG: hypothetical protein B7733_13550 [Myxococcales bacterium FL481]